MDSSASSRQEYWVKADRAFKLYENTCISRVQFKLRWSNLRGLAPTWGDRYLHNVQNRRYRYPTCIRRYVRCRICRKWFRKLKLSCKWRSGNIMMFTCVLAIVGKDRQTIVTIKYHTILVKKIKLVMVPWEVAWLWRITQPSASTMYYGGHVMKSVRAIVVAKTLRRASGDLRANLQRAAYFF